MSILSDEKLENESLKNENKLLQAYAKDDFYAGILYNRSLA
ncbi:MAG TPA: hypothetical protein VIY08_08845 [Candidatus Nitrosocosmicus sp.]